MATSNRSHLHLEKMPLLVLETVCGLLHQKDLFAFSETNSFCSMVSLRRFENIHLDLSSRIRLRIDLDKWDSTLSTRKAYRYVRQVKLTGSLSLREEEGEEIESDGIDDLGSVSSMDEDSEPHDQSNSVDSRLSTAVIASSKPTREQYQARTWAFLVQFLCRLGGLTDLVFSCEDKVPKPLVLALQEHHPRCRLHVSPFTIGSTDAAAHHPDEMALVTSPCLHSITARYPESASRAEETIMLMVAGRAPNLKHVIMSPVSHFAWVNRIPVVMQEPPFTMFGDDAEPLRKGSLESLVLWGNSLNSESLKAWERHTDLASLRSLGLQSSMSLSTVRALVEITGNGNFQSLQSLTMNLTPGYFQSENALRAVVVESKRFLENLPPTLEVFSAIGFIIDPTFNALLQRHGPTLRDICIQPICRITDEVAQHFVISAKHIQELERTCPVLTDLRLLIPRTEGDEKEVAIYRALGRLPRIRRLSLVLNCAQMQTPVQGHPEDLEHANRLGISDASIRKMFINAAVDQKLAASIFDMISSPTLEHLMVHVCGAGDFGGGILDANIRSTMEWIGRSWSCKKDITADGGDKIDIKEALVKVSTNAGNYLVDNINTCWFGKIWEDVWPRHTPNWKTDWSSFPLRPSTN